MNLTTECPHCHAAMRASFGAGQRQVVCSACGRSIALRAEAMEGVRVPHCPLCGTEDMYTQKDFPHALGLAIVVLAAVLSSIAWWQYLYPLALGILLVAAALDMCLYYLVGDALVCYRCHAQFRGAERQSAHQPFDLGVGERYRQERLRIDLLREQAAKSDAPQGPPG
jgi:predicted RNA-binding Zn-ribbon protein involved in translation (DUF1610 family)